MSTIHSSADQSNKMWNRWEECESVVGSEAPSICSTTRFNASLKRQQMDLQKCRDAARKRNPFKIQEDAVRDIQRQRKLSAYIVEIKNLEDNFSNLTTKHNKISSLRKYRVQCHQAAVQVLNEDIDRLRSANKEISDQIQTLKAWRNEELSQLKESVDIEKARRMIQLQKQHKAVQQIAALKAAAAKFKQKESSRLQHIQRLSTELNAAQRALECESESKSEIPVVGESNMVHQLA